MVRAPGQPAPTRLARAPTYPECADLPVCADRPPVRPTRSNGGRLEDDPDLVTGLLGVAIYALARRERALAAAVVARLRACSMADGDSVICALFGSPSIGGGQSSNTAASESATSTRWR